MNRSALSINLARREYEWAVILAGGDGTRLKSLTRKIAGDENLSSFAPCLEDGLCLKKPESELH